MRARRTVASLVLATLMAGCAAAPPAAPKADQAAIDKDIRGLVTGWTGYIAARNDSAIAELYAEDGVLMPPNQPRIEGKAGIRSFFAGLWAINPTMALNTKQVVASDAGDVAIEEGTFTLAYPTPDGGKVEDTGKYLVIWKKTEQGWKVVRDIFNTDLPPAPPPAAK